MLRRSPGQAGPLVMYVQYTNPGAYPPIQHGIRILADAGATILVLGTGGFGVDALTLRDHPNVRVRLLPFASSGWLQKLHYMFFCVWVACWNFRFRPDWIYASDAFACPATLLALVTRSAHLVYHEHDSPSSAISTPSRFMKIVYRARRAVSRRADVCVLPQEERARLFSEATGRVVPPLRVWNCPSADECVPASRVRSDSCPLRLAYFGTIVPNRLPVSLLEAVAELQPRVTLSVAGYETVGSRGYMARLLERARELGIEGLVSYHGTVRREDLIAWAAGHDVGVALMPMESADDNMRFMVGASNKPFDYLAAGLALLVSDLPDWKSMYTNPGYGRGCDPRSTESLADALRWFLEHRAETAEMGAAGQARIRREWHYEHQFSAVRDRVLSRDDHWRCLTNSQRPTGRKIHEAASG